MWKRKKKHIHTSEASRRKNVDYILLPRNIRFHSYLSIMCLKLNTHHSRPAKQTNQQESMHLHILDVRKHCSSDANIFVSHSGSVASLSLTQTHKHTDTYTDQLQAYHTCNIKTEDTLLYKLINQNIVNSRKTKGHRTLTVV